MQNNVCDGNCFYCANRKDRDFKRVSFSPQELARLFIQYYERGVEDFIRPWKRRRKASLMNSCFSEFN